MHDLPSQCKSEGSPGHGQTGEDNFGEGLVRLSINRVSESLTLFLLRLISVPGHGSLAQNFLKVCSVNTP